MKIETVYISDDGKKFYTEEECLKYEAGKKYKEFEDSVLLFDENGKKLPLSWNGMSECTYMVCKTVEAACFVVDEFSNSFGLPWRYNHEVTAGAWIIDESGEWQDLKEFLKKAETAQRIAKMV